MLDMPKIREFRSRRGEQGQTIILVAAALISLLAMAALAIDVVTLYVARGELQRAADAAALAGAKGIADSGITTLQTSDANYANAEILAQGMATAGITAVVQTNLVAGTAPQIQGSPAPNYTYPNNPYITVTLKQPNLPTFFARIWGAGLSTAIASATAEVYNPSNPPGGFYTRVTPSSVKPWLVANKDPGSGNPFINETTGVVLNVIGEQFDLQSDCQNTAGTVCQLQTNPPGIGAGYVQYVPAQVQSPAYPADVCPSSACVAGSEYESSVQCADVKPYSCGGATTNAAWDNQWKLVGAGNASATATQCLITNGTGSGQDTLAPILPGFSGPPQITGGTWSPAPTQLVSTSVSIMTVPIIDVTTPLPVAGGPVTIVGFLQVFVNQVQATGNINVTVLNVSGCGQNQYAYPAVVGGSGSSPVPVRLISAP